MTASQPRDYRNDRPLHLHQLTEALEAISDGFALFDPDERLVLVNGKFRDMFGESAVRLVPGTKYEALLRAAVLAGENPDALGRDPECYIQERLATFRVPPVEPFEFQLHDGRWVLVSDHKTADGGTVCIRTDISELKRRERALRESERRYRQLVDLSPDGIAVYDFQGRGRFLNAAGRRILGVPDGADVSRFNVLEFAAEETRARAAEMLAKTAQHDGRPVMPVRYIARRTDGTTLVTEATGVPFSSGGENLILALFRDVSDEESDKRRLQESEARARSIMDTALDGIVSIDSDGLILEFNPAAERIFGWTRAEVLGRPIGEVLIPGHHRAAHEAGMDRMAKGGAPRMLGRRVEIEALRRDGAVFPVELSITEVTLEHGKRYTAYIRDITDRKRAEREIYDKTRIIDAMLETVGIGIEIFDGDGHLLAANRHLKEMFDLPDRLMRPGTHDKEILRFIAERGEYPEETVEQTMASYDSLRAEGAYFDERQRPNGDWVQVRHFPMPGGGYVGLFTDVTEQKRLEMQLLQSQKMDALGQLAGGIAHEFNNILSVIGGYASMAQGMVDPDGPVPGYLSKISAGVQRAAALTRELLTFSRRKPVQARTVDLAAVVRGQEFLLNPLLGETIELLFMLPEEPVWVSIDPDMAAQVLVNLAINARDAMPRGGPLAVMLQTSGGAGRPPPELPGGRYCVLTVADRGTGMPDEVKSRIFEPFFTTKPPGQGTGLGLAMVYGVVKQAGGTITVDSRPGSGTTMRIWLPEAEAPAEPIAAAPVQAAKAPTDRPATILVVEDEPDLLELVRDTLLGAGYTVRTAADGVEALERFEEGGIDLLLTDLVMPELGGARLAQLVTELDPAVRVLFMTGYPSRGQYASSDLPRDAVVLAKPIDLATLRTAVAQALAGTLTRAGAATLQGEPAQGGTGMHGLANGHGTGKDR